jgi:K+-transporting ATPase ATPase C chain
VVAYRQFNGLAADVPVPVDAVTAPGSGLDPDISVANAIAQTSRVAKIRHLDPARVAALVRSHTDARAWGVLGEKTVNVLDLNLALDKLSPSG